MFNFGNSNEGQRTAISSADGPVLIIAGPGTGKTYTLVQRTIYLIEECGVKPESIFIATFTEKAAKELITRITNELSERGISVNINEMYIGTFHSLCLRILKEHLEFTRLKKNYRLLDSFDQQYTVYQNIYSMRNSVPGFSEVIQNGSLWDMSAQVCSYVNMLSEELVSADDMSADPNPQISALGKLLIMYQGILEANNYENVKSEEFLRDAVKRFWERYGGNTYEELNPKLAIYAASIEEAVSEVKPALENILSELGIPLTKILLNVGDAKYTKNDDIRNFNNLDVRKSEGNDKRFIILVEKGKEGWNCRSLFGVALFRNPSSKIFVLQATMRCLRSITDEGHTATIFLSKENFDILDDELHKNFNMTINDLKEPSNAERRRVQVHVMPPQRSIKLKHVWHEYSLHGKEYTEPLDFKLAETDFSKYTSKIYERESIAADTTVKEKNADDIRNDVRYSKLTLIGEISRYLNISCITVSRILDESVDGTEYILETVNKYNAVLDDIIIPSIFHALFEVTSEIKSEERELILLKEPKNAGYYEFSAKEDLILTNKYLGFTPEQIGKSFHADVYCFDSVPEKECFRQYITSNKVKPNY